MLYREAAPVVYGVGIALGIVDPGMEYYRAVTDGEGEALLLKARTEAMRS